MRESTTGNKLVSQLDYLHADRVRASGSVSSPSPTHLGLIIHDIIYILSFFLSTCPFYFLPHRPYCELCVCVRVRAPGFQNRNRRGKWCCSSSHPRVSSPTGSAAAVVQLIGQDPVMLNVRERSDDPKCVWTY